MKRLFILLALLPAVTLADISLTCNANRIRALFDTLNVSSCSFFVVEEGEAHNGGGHYRVIPNASFWEVWEGNRQLERFTSETDAKDRLVEYFTAINGFNATVDDFKSVGAYNCANSLLF